MDAATRLIIICCFLLTGNSLTRASEENPDGRRSHGDEPNKDRQQVSEVNLVGQGQPATFTCSAVSSKAMDVSWTHNGTLLQVAPGPNGDEATGTTGEFTVITRHEPLKSAPGGVLKTLTRSQLRLHHVSLDDAGVYGCEFSDHHGILSRSSRLIVKPMNVTVETCLEGRSCLGAHKLCNVSTLKCQCRPGYSTSQRNPAVCVPENILRMGQGHGEPCNSSIPCSEAHTECNKPGQCLCALGTVWRDGSCAEDKFRLVSWLIWVAASAAVIAAILVAAKVTALILRKRNYRRGNLLRVTDDSIVSDEEGNDGGDHIQERRPDHPDHQSASRS
uniref:Putative secreted protein n=1 Tax=Ixodes ricinus TaxID=34613 RepID=V5IBS1_IXORI